MKLKITLLLLLLTAVLTACDSPEYEQGVSETVEETAVSATISAPAADQFSDYAAFIEAMMEEDGIPGVAAAIVDGDETVFMQGFGFQDVEQAVPVSTKTLFHIGSITKSMTAMMVAALIDDGLFTWDTPVIDIYPDFALSSPESTKTVTMRHLLGMQSGIPDDAEDGFDIDYATAEDVFDFVADAQLDGEPGERFSYSNLSASLAGYVAVMAAAQGEDGLYDGYARLLTATVLEPIGMKTAVVNVSDAQNSPHYGKSYILNDDGQPVAAEQEDFDGDPLAPSGVVKANVEEMALYVSTQLNGGQAPNGQRVVSQQALAETWKPDLEEYGMGWEVKTYEGVEIVMHEGSYDNYLSVIGFIPEFNIGFVVLTNSEEAGERLIVEAPTFLVDSMLNE